MKRWIVALIMGAFLAGTVLPACSRKSGCPANESLKPKTNKKGEIVGKKKNNSGLFPKDMKKRMK